MSERYNRWNWAPKDPQVITSETKVLYDSRDLPFDLLRRGFSRDKEIKDLLHLEAMTGSGSPRKYVWDILADYDRDLLAMGFTKIRLNGYITFDIATGNQVPEPEESTPRHDYSNYKNTQLAKTELTAALKNITFTGGVSLIVENKKIITTDPYDHDHTNEHLIISIVILGFGSKELIRIPASSVSSGDGRGPDQYSYNFDIDQVASDVKKEIEANANYKKYLVTS